MPIMTTFRITAIIVGVLAAIGCFMAALVNLSKIKKRRTSTLGKGMCIYLIIISVILAIQSALFLAM